MSTIHYIIINQLLTKFKFYNTKKVVLDNV